MNPQVDNYLAEGCGRCKLGGTPQCKVHRWVEGLMVLRSIVLDCGLVEERKWGVPVYTNEKGKNVVGIYAFKDNFTLSFFKGVLLNDEDQILVPPGENSQVFRLVRFTDIEKVVELELILKKYIQKATELENTGAKITHKPTSEFAIVAELQAKFEENPDFKAAFDALTPGRQRGYLLHFAAAKQSATRTARIEKYMPLIFAGKGMQE